MDHCMMQCTRHKQLMSVVFCMRDITPSRKQTFDLHCGVCSLQQPEAHILRDLAAASSGAVITPTYVGSYPRTHYLASLTYSKQYCWAAMKKCE